MANVESGSLPHDAVLWPMRPGSSDSYGKQLVDAPEQIRVEWKRKRTESGGQQSTAIHLDAQAVVDRRINIGSQIWLGTLEDFYGTGSGNVDNEIMRVVSYDEADDIKARGMTRIIGLQRLQNQHGPSS